MMNGQCWAVYRCARAEEIRLPRWGGHHDDQACSPAGAVCGVASITVRGVRSSLARRVHRWRHARDRGGGRQGRLAKPSRHVHGPLRVAGRYDDGLGARGTGRVERPFRGAGRRLHRCRRPGSGSRAAFRSPGNLAPASAYLRWKRARARFHTSSAAMVGRIHRRRTHRSHRGRIHRS